MTSNRTPNHESAPGNAPAPNQIPTPEHARTSNKAPTPGNVPASNQTPNSDIINLPTSPRDVQEGATPLNPHQQVEQLSNYFEDNYPEVFTALTTDEGVPYKNSGQPVPRQLVEATERHWARTADLISHTSLLVLGAGLDHRMPHTAFIGHGQVTVDAQPATLEGLPEGVKATMITPQNPDGSVAISLHGGPGWFGDGESHEQFWLPLFASIAAQSRTTVVDVTYPLPGYGSWDKAQTAVERTFDIVRSALCHGAHSCGVIAFGSGLIAAEKTLTNADFLLAMTPRLAEGFAERTREALVGKPVLVTIADVDTRGTDAATCAAWAELLRDGAAEPGDAGGQGHAKKARVQIQQWPSEHIIAAPTVWRERISAAGQWLREDAAGR